MLKFAGKRQPSGQRYFSRPVPPGFGERWLDGYARSFPFRLLGVEGEVDLGAEKILAAEKDQNGQKVRIVVEIKSFIGATFM